MNATAYVAVGYGLSAIALITYTWRVLTRGRRVSAEVPEERRRWM
ncbi:MAG: hypothetical protein AB7W59_19205 [Acidimicrobiia bacterium]